MDLRLRAEFKDDRDALIVHELGLSNGEVRVDVAVINGTINGYEIKSPADTLQRLPMQQAVYGRVLETVTLVAPKRHLDEASESLPDWWGLLEIDLSSGAVDLRAVRRPSLNPSVDASVLVQLLWRDEAVSILAAHGIDAGLRSKPRRAAWERIVEYFDGAQVSALVRQQLKSRERWRESRGQGRARSVPSRGMGAQRF